MQKALNKAKPRQVEEEVFMDFSLVKLKTVFKYKYHQEIHLFLISKLIQVSRGFLPESSSSSTIRSSPEIGLHSTSTSPSLLLCHLSSPFQPTDVLRLVSTAPRHLIHTVSSHVSIFSLSMINESLLILDSFHHWSSCSCHIVCACVIIAGAFKTHKPASVSYFPCCGFTSLGFFRTSLVLMIFTFNQLSDIGFCLL